MLLKCEKAENIWTNWYSRVFSNAEIAGTIPNIYPVKNNVSEMYNGKTYKFGIMDK